MNEWSERVILVSDLVSGLDSHLESDLGVVTAVIEKVGWLTTG